MSIEILCLLRDSTNYSANVEIGCIVWGIVYKLQSLRSLMLLI